jgi:hypothetical protein
MSDAAAVRERKLKGSDPGQCRDCLNNQEDADI